MKIKFLHDWNLSPQQAIEIQKQLRYEVEPQDQFDEPIKTVAGIDLGYDVKNDTSRAVVVVLSFPELELLETSEAHLPIQFPYVPGLLSFRETPVAIKALEKLKITPDVILCDGLRTRTSARIRHRLPCRNSGRCSDNWCSKISVGWKV